MSDDYSKAKTKIERLITRMRADLTAYAAAPGSSTRAVHTRLEQINTIITFFNAAEEQIAALEVQPAAPIGAGYVADPELEKAILAYWFPYGSNYFQAERLIEFLATVHHAGKMELFKAKFSAYCELKNITGYKHGFYSYLGTKEKQFEDGHWALNWATQLAIEKAKTKPVPVTKKLTAIERRNQNLAAR